MGPDIHF